MVAGQDINFDLIHALGKDKEGQKGKEDGEEERNQDQEQRPRSLSAGPSRYICSFVVGSYLIVRFPNWDEFVLGNLTRRLESRKSPKVVSSWKVKRKKKSKEAGECGGSKVSDNTFFLHLFSMIAICHILQISTFTIFGSIFSTQKHRRI